MFVVQVWAHAVVEKLRGANAGLEEALDQVFAGSFECDGVKFPTIPANAPEVLRDYLAEMSVVKN